MRKIIATIAACGLSACGGSPPGNEAGTGAPAATADVGPAGDCSNLPDFVSAYADAKFVGCFRGGSPIANHESGTIIYTTAANPLTLRGWYKGQARINAMADSLNGETSYSARDRTKRSFMVMMAPAAGGTKVTLNWGRDL